jgi:hypothetical protein
MVTVFDVGVTAVGPLDPPPPPQAVHVNVALNASASTSNDASLRFGAIGMNRRPARRIVIGRILCAVPVDRSVALGMAEAFTVKTTFCSFILAKLWLEGLKLHCRPEGNPGQLKLAV